jgi:hypothetical protein
MNGSYGEGILAFVKLGEMLEKAGLIVLVTTLAIGSLWLFCRWLDR